MNHSDVQFGDGSRARELISALSRIVALDRAGFVLAGGLAVMARVGSAFRATDDIDTVIADLERASELVNTLAGATRSAARSWATVGDVKLDLIEVDHSARWDDILDLSDDDEAGFEFTAGHRFVWDEHSPVRLVAGTEQVTVECGTARALLTAKLGASFSHTRDPTKHSSDALDVWRLLEVCRTGTIDRRPGYRLDSAMPPAARLALTRMVQRVRDDPVRLQRRLRPIAEPPTSEQLDATCARTLDALGAAGDRHRLRHPSDQ